MKKISALILIALMVVVFSPQAFAKSEMAGTGGGTSVATLTVSPTIGVANQNQVKTQNAGENSQLMVNTAEQESAGESTISAMMRSEVAVERMSEVSKNVAILLQDKSLTGGIGQQVKVIAQEQKDSTEKTQNQIKNIDSRGGFLKALIGPDYKSLKNLEMQVEQNQLRIQALTELKNQLVNTGDIALVSETINSLIEQNVSLQDIISAENRLGSVFGWFIKLFIN